MACVSADDPDRQHQTVSWSGVSLSVTLFAMYDPVVVRVSAPALNQLDDHPRIAMLRTQDHPVLEIDSHANIALEWAMSWRIGFSSHGGT